jgi:DNA-binding XRE family transcriptional regulator
MTTLPRLRDLRLRAMLTQVALAKKGKVTEQTIVNAEAGKRVTFSTAQKVAAALNVTPQALAGIEE